MKKLPYFLFSIFIFCACNDMNNSIQDASKGLTAPVADKIDSVLSIHGDDRVDPYFWMRLTDEQKNADDPDAQTQKVIDYLNAENIYKEKVLKQTEALQASLYDEIVGRIKKTDESLPYFKNGYWYYTRYEEGKEYPIYCRKKGTMNGTEEVMLDVNELAEGHDYYAASSLQVSPDNKILAFGEDTLSRRIYSIRFKNLETGEFLEDRLENAAFGGAWANDNQTYFYISKNKVSLLSEKVWRHQIGTFNNDDVMVYHEKDPSFYLSLYKSKSDDYIFILSSSTLVNDFRMLDANNPKGSFRQFIPREKDHLYSLYHYEDKFYILTNWEATNFRLMESSLDAQSKADWKEVIPHKDDVLLDNVEVFKNYLAIGERSNALTHIKIINQSTQEEHYLDFEEAAYVAGISTNREFDTDSLRFVFTSLKTPISIYDYHMRDKGRTLKKRYEVEGGYEPDDYNTERFFVEARDGAKVPVSLVYKKGFKKNGQAPLLLYSYGSYGSSTEPFFSSDRLSLLDRGFVWALAHVRGGQEMGRDWYESGKLLHKKNTFNDFVDCARYLSKEKYSSPEHMYALGGSAGGLLMGAVANQAPNDFNGIIAAVPFVDVISTMLDETIPLTSNEFDEWGNPKIKEYYDYMLSYSPYDQVKAQYYPHMLVTTGFFDSQVQYWEPAKWVAKLRDQKTDDNLLLLDTDMKVGHGGASGRFARHKKTALNYSFLLMLEGKLE